MLNCYDIVNIESKSHDNSEIRYLKAEELTKLTYFS